MNSRLYDPIVGRMLAVDNEVPDAASTQGYNRYTYAMNNPLKYVDPDGENPLLAFVGGGFSGIFFNGVNNLFNGDPFFFNAGNAGFFGGVQGVFSFGIGEAGMPGGLNLLAHGHLGGIMTATQGGKYHHGVLSSFAGAAVGLGA